jgi:catechol 2,3-dioxygenase-like lactoylglutathione lyase family enzyme
MSLPVIEEQIKFHLSLNVPDLDKAVAFYRTLFGREPEKHHADYAKFELDEPPVVFSLAPHTPGQGASLSHLGLRVSEDATIEAFRTRLELAGLCTQAQENTTCGYARQNKLWVKDPFGNFWEIYRIEEEVRPDAIRTSIGGAAARTDVESCAASAAASTSWEHGVGHEFPERIPHEDESLDEVRLVGTFNMTITPIQIEALLKESFRVLKPGGKLLTHGLMGDKPIPGSQPKLPGLAAMVSRVPPHTEPIEALRAAGFTGVQFVKFTEKAWFSHEGVSMREVKLVAWKPGRAENETREVMYKGPFAKAAADAGRSFERGRRTTVPLAVWQSLRLGPAAEQFLFFEGTGTCN